MRRLRVPLALFAFAGADAASVPRVVWARELVVEPLADAGGESVGASVVALPGGGALLLGGGAGRIGGVETSAGDALLADVGPDGDLRGFRTFGGAGNQSGLSLALDTTNRAWLGLVEYASQGVFDSRVLRVDRASGSVMLDVRVTDGGRGLAWGVAPWAEGAIWAGVSVVPGTSTPTGMLGSVTNGGGHLANPLGAGVEPVAIVPVGDGVVIAGRFRGGLALPGCAPVTADGGAASTGFVARFGFGTMRCTWVRALEATGVSSVGGLAASPVGAVVVAGSFAGSLGGSPPVAAGSFVARLELASGEISWVRTLAGSVDVRGVALDAEERVVVTGWLGGAVDFGGGVVAPDGTWGHVVYGRRADGTHDFALRVGKGDVRGYSVSAAPDGALYVGGTAYGTSALEVQGALPTPRASRSYVVKIVR